MVNRTRSRRTAVAALVLLPSCVVCSWPQGAFQLTVQTLEGTRFSIPGDLSAAVNILVIGFTRKAGAAARPWTERLERDFPVSRGFAVYPVAVLAGVPALFRAFALAATRSDSAPLERSRTLVALSDEAAWKKLAGFQEPDDPCVVVLDRAGSVLVRAQGTFQEPGYEAASAAIRAAQEGKAWTN